MVRDGISSIAYCNFFFSVGLFYSFSLAVRYYRRAKVSSNLRQIPAFLQVSTAVIREPVHLSVSSYLHPSRSIIGRTIEVVAILFGISQFILYLYNTYQNVFTTTSIIFTCIFSGFFTVRYLIRLYIAEPGRRVKWALHFDSVIDVIVTIGSFLPAFAYVNTFYTLTYLRMINVYFAWRALDVWLEPTLLLSRVQRHLIRMILLVTAFLASMGPTLAILETAGDPDGWSSIVDPLQGFTLFNSLYFSVVTIATVGYGDIVPITFLGRLFTILFIIAGIAIVGQLTSQLIEILGSVRPGGGAFLNPTRRYLVLIVGETSPAQLQDILSELFHSERYGVRQLLHVIIMVEPRSFRTGLYKYFRAHPIYMHFVTYLRGSVFSRLDLVRAAADTPEMQAIFVVQRRFARSDTSNLLRVLALRRHLPHIPLYVMLAHSTNRHILEATGVKEEFILELDALRHGLLAINAITPGTAPILINLFSMDIVPSEDRRLASSRRTKSYFGKRYTSSISHTMAPFSSEATITSSSSARTFDVPEPRYGLNTVPSSTVQPMVEESSPEEGTFRSLINRFRRVFKQKESIEPVLDEDMGGGSTVEGLREENQGTDAPNSVNPEQGLRFDTPSPVTLTSYPTCWQDEYGEGLGQEIYEITCPTWLTGHTYLSAVILIYCSRLLHAKAVENRTYTESRTHQPVTKHIWNKYQTKEFVASAQIPLTSEPPLSYSNNRVSPLHSFSSIESLIQTLLPDLEKDDIEGPVLIGIRHKSKRTGSIALRCDMTRKYRLKENDSLILVARDISIIGEAILENITASLVTHVDESVNVREEENTYRTVGTTTVLSPDASSSPSNVISSSVTIQPLPTIFDATIPAVPDPTTTDLPRYVHAPEGSRTSSVSYLPGSVGAISIRNISTPLSTRLPTQESSSQNVIPVSTTSASPLHRTRSLPFITTDDRKAVSPSLPPLTPFRSRDIGRIGKIPGEGIRNHIVVITDGWLHSLRLFIQPLRQVSNRPIVILSPSDPDEWLIKLMQEQYYNFSQQSSTVRASVSHSVTTTTYPSSSDSIVVPNILLRGPIYFVRGDPLLENDLRLAYVQTARRVVIFTGLPPEGFEGTSSWNVTAAIDEAISDISKLSKEKSVSESYIWSTTGEEISQVSEALVDAVGILTTMVIEGRLGALAPLLIYGITTEIALNRSVELLPGPSALRALGIHPPVTSLLHPKANPSKFDTETKQNEREDTVQEYTEESNKANVPFSSQRDSKRDNNGTVQSLIANVPSQRMLPPVVRYMSSISTAEDINIPHGPANVDGEVPTEIFTTTPLRQEVSLNSNFRPLPYSLFNHGSMKIGPESKGPVSPVPIREISSIRRLPSQSSTTTTTNNNNVTDTSPTVGPPIEESVPYAYTSSFPRTNDPLESAEPGHLRWSIRYAGGRLFPTSCLNNLLVASFYNPSLIRMIHMFARGDKLRLRHVQIPSSLLHQSRCPLRYPNPARTVVETEDTEPSSPRMVVSPSNRGTDTKFTTSATTTTGNICYCRISYAKLFLHIVLKFHLVPIGLFRDRTWLGSPLPYIHSNPHMNANVRCGDVIFVVAPVSS